MDGRREEKKKEEVDEVIDECVRLRLFLRHLGGTVFCEYRY